MKALMCPPLYYEPAEGEDASTVMAEWRGLYRLLRDELDVQVDLLEPRPGMPGLVLAASGGLVWDDSFIASRFRDGSRQPEREVWENYFLVRGYAMQALPGGCCFEGERDLVIADGMLFAGYRSADDLAAHDALSEMVKREVHSLRLSDEWDWPLDTCLCPLSGNGALYHPQAFRPDARKVVESRLPGLRPVDVRDARRLGCSVLVAYENVILPEGCESTAALLEPEGFHAHILPLKSYARHGAGPTALALTIED